MVEKDQCQSHVALFVDDGRNSADQFKSILVLLLPEEFIDEGFFRHPPCVVTLIRLCQFFLFLLFHHIVSLLKLLLRFSNILYK